MASAGQIATKNPEQSRVGQPFYSNSDLADRWRCSRGSVYNRPRGERVMDLAAPGRRGHKLIPLETVQRIERPHLRVLR